MMYYHLKLSAGMFEVEQGTVLYVSIPKMEIILTEKCSCKISSRYQEYRSEYISTQKRTFFNAHKDEDWYILYFVYSDCFFSFHILHLNKFFYFMSLF